ncbi:MAG: MrtC family glutamic-type intramembrane protease [Myxococcales bacterium]|jgi:membrane protease YdiL (CAAX protease family)
MGADAAGARTAIREALGVYAAVTVATVAISAAGRLPGLGDYVHLAVGVLFLSAAVHMAGRHPDGLRRYGLQLGGLLEPPEEAPGGPWASLVDLARALTRAAGPALRELAVALAVALLVFPPFTLGFYLWHRPQAAFELTLPDALPSYLLSQLLVVALPEEAFFRGYLQGRLTDARPRRVRVLRAELSLPALLGTSALFALIHFAVDLNPTRLAVFFPSLLFGWLRELRGGIGAAVGFHALCNLLSDVLVRSWL